MELKKKMPRAIVIAVVNIHLTRQAATGQKIMAKKQSFFQFFFQFQAAIKVFEFQLVV